jgi:hypothetical protein
MTYAMICTIVDGWVAGRKYELAEQRLEVARAANTGDKVVIEARDFPGVLSHGPGVRREALTLAALHANPTVREKGLEPFVVSTIERLIEELIGERIADDDLEPAGRRGRARR